eukprot:1196367-Prorocentrum_minimum.AAC.5
MQRSCGFATAIIQYLMSASTQRMLAGTKTNRRRADQASNCTNAKSTIHASDSKSDPPFLPPLSPRVALLCRPHLRKSDPPLFPLPPGIRRLHTELAPGNSAVHNADASGVLRFIVSVPRLTGAPVCPRPLLHPPACHAAGGAAHGGARPRPSPPGPRADPAPPQGGRRCAHGPSPHGPGGAARGASRGAACATSGDARHE